MRIIGRLPHPKMQITVFQNDGRFPVQFEMHGQSQQYRFRQSDALSNLGHIEAIVDEEFKRGVLETFAAMRKIQSRVIADHLEDPADNELPEIF